MTRTKRARRYRYLSPAAAMLVVLSAPVTARAVVSPGTGPASQSSTGESASAEPPTVQALRDTGPDQRRWMSLPGSRVVVNPYNFNLLGANRTPGMEKPTAYSNGPQLPMNVGYYVGDRAEEIPQAASLYMRDGERTPRLRSALDDDFSTLSGEWDVSPQLSTELIDGQAKLTVHDTIAASISRSLEINVDQTPFLQITVPRTEGKWSLQVRDGAQSPLIFLQRDTDQTGAFTFDLPRATGWHGTKSFWLSFVAIYQERPTYLDHLRIVGVDSPMQTAASFETEWLPGELPFHATYPNGVALSGSDAFHDRDTVVRSIDLQPSSGEGNPVPVVTVAGKFAGKPSWDRKSRTLTVTSAGYSYAVSFSLPLSGEPRLYRSAVDFLLQNPSQEVDGEGFWSVDIPLPVARRSGPAELGMSIAFAPGDNAGALARERASRPVLDGTWRGAVSEQTRFWDRLLAGVPQPHDFAVHGVPASGVTPDEVRREYYTAWVHIASNVLPPMPETGFHYPQIANGKASLWNFGAPGAKPSAQWESVLEMQFFAYVDPDLAWQAYKGLLSLVSHDGEMGGESLPSRKAQTADVLYRLTGDQASLRSVYPALKRHLLWERDNPRWICCGEDPAVDFPNERDSDFVVSLLVDMRYAREIAGILKIPGEVEFWNQQRTQLFENYLRWLWPSTSDPVQYHFVGEERCNYRGDCRGNDLDVAIGLNVELLDSEHAAGLTNRFDASYDPTDDFAGFTETRYPEFSLASYGLLAHGMPERTAVLANAYLRDIVRAHMFAESYVPHEGTIRPTGVRPSSFAAMTVIDAVWMKNGYRADLGWPHFVALPGETGGLDGIRILGRRLNENIAPAAAELRLSGSLISPVESCQRLRLPVGETIALPQPCIAGRQQLPG
ncbi:hypothetical protein [Micromonospora sp. ATA51]|uniref:hypothetical protein n=1 Tax=Micromonospora sp. ATA51 TaxID=2806098 RepID=UPI001A4C7E16|nr:hypothetical protein [Micromonospora sp. ATA51]MBM0224272.1 hypothetical protein [Micromonospora sp. ATA51]